MFDVGGELVGAETVFGGGDEDRRQFFPVFEKTGLVRLDVLFEFHLAEFVRFGEDERKGNAVLAEPVDEGKVNLLRFVAAVNEHKETDELFAQKAVPLNHPSERFALFLTRLGKTVTGKVNEVPLSAVSCWLLAVGGCTFYKKVVDEQCLAGFLARFGEFGIVAQRIDEAGFADVTAPDESELG